MQVNKFMTLAVGLVVGVLLIAGVVAPVIANVSSDSENTPKTYTNEGTYRFSFTNENTDYSIYSTGDGQISLQPSSVEDRTLYDYSDIVIITEDLDYNNCIFAYSDVLPNDSYFTFNGSALSSSDWGDYEYPILLATNPIGECVNVVTWSKNSLDDNVPTLHTPHAFADTKFFMMFYWWGDDKPAVDALFYGDSQSNTLVYGDTTTSATVSIVDDVLSSFSFDIDGKQYTVPFAVSDNPDDDYCVPVDDLYFSLDCLILPVSVTGNSNNNPPVVPSTGEKMGIEMAHFSSVNDFAIIFNKGQDDNGVPCFIFQPSFDAEIPLYAYPGQILYADGHSIVTVEKDANGEPFIWLNYIGTEYDESQEPPVPVDGIYLVKGDSSVTLNYRYAFRPTVDQEGITPNVSTGSTEFGYYIPIYNEGITNWGGFLERGIYTIVDGSARIGDMPVVGLVRGSSDCVSFFANGTYGGNTYSFEYDLSDGVVSNLHGQITGVNSVLDKGYSVLGYDLIPEEGGGSSGNGISSTIKATLTVIPLVMTVGLILGAITFLRMKN